AELVPGLGRAGRASRWRCHRATVVRSGCRGAWMGTEAEMTYDANASTWLDGRVAIVTGGGSRGDGIGNGRASAMLLALRGAKVLVADLEIESAGDTVQRILDA